MGKKKKPKKIGPAQKIARGLLQGFLQLLFYSIARVRFDRTPALDYPCVMAVYHDELLPLVYHYRNDLVGPIASIASQNHFGYAISKIMEGYGYEMALGSQSRGGKDAFFKLLRAARNGKTIAFSVDGSRGPRHKMKAGALTLARKSGLPLYLVRAEYAGWRIRSTWDKFKIPYPTANVRFHYQRFALEDYDDAEFDVILAAADAQLAALLADDYQP